MNNLMTEKMLSKMVINISEPTFKLFRKKFLKEIENNCNDKDGKIKSSEIEMLLIICLSELNINLLTTIIRGLNMENKDNKSIHAIKLQNLLNELFRMMSESFHSIAKDIKKEKMN